MLPSDLMTVFSTLKYAALQEILQKNLDKAYW